MSFSMIALVSTTIAARAQTPTADQLLAKIDAQLHYESRTSRVRMTVVNARRTREFEMVTFGRGADDAAIEYVSPERDKGTKMLKKADELWMYLPSVERVQKISGHMLREGMMGSDVSYEDMMNNAELRKSYTAKVTGENTVDGRKCWTLELVATTAEVTYPKRVSCVDEETFIPLSQELFALSGMLLKSWTMSDIRKEGDRWVPYRMRIVDALQQGSYTEIVILESKFGVDLPEEVFTTRWLERI
ncbi:MAG: outer membrane lipoprotein-sorting protein [Myxococcota bacterium]